MLHDKAARGAAFFWLIAIAAIFAAFIVLNPPLRYAAIALGPLGAAAIFVAACIGFGRVARGDDFATCAALGAGIIGAGSFFIALAHAIRPVSFVVILGCGVIAFIYFALDFVRRSPFAVDRTLGKQPSANGQRRTGWIFLAVITTVILPFVVLSIVHLVERRFVLAGVLFGFATWTKYTFVLAAIGIAAILIRERARDWFRFAIPVIAIAAIWTTKNALLTGNPVYPFLN